MFAYPKQAEFNRPIPKTKIYAHARPPKRVKECFASQLNEIVWRYKLAPETINLPARHGINEIQVFELKLRVPELDEAVLHAIDKAVSFPVMFEMTFDGSVRFAAAYKRPSESDSSKWVISTIFTTDTQSLNTARSPLPVALDLAALYEHMLRRYIPLPARSGESIADHIERHNALVAKKKAHQQMQVRLMQEKQFKRKVELNAQLRELTAELARLQQ